MTQIVATFYKFVPLSDLNQLRARLQSYCVSEGIKGTILLATEGINGTISGTRSQIDNTLAHLRSQQPFADLRHRESTAQDTPFKRLKVKIKKEIVTLGKPEINPNEKVGTYVSPQDWNGLIQDPEVTVIDTRNGYEVDIGTFKRAIDPRTHHFREFPQYVTRNLDPGKHQKIAMFCTGGIRCEKASAYLLSQGFKEVYHLQGGILNYLEQIDPEESLWEGDCFVFDERVALAHELTETHYRMCRGCGHPINAVDKASPHYEEGVSCPYCYDRLTPEKKERLSRRRPLI
ncbi:MAG: hypothetical protein N5P05_002292 [Chroococcopsis gigantea SAG 12.99]|jgi:UPF0176 protein|nr:rhodanese-related sulfurtransferase [Chlorogloea purpurea SAG 13.99]MDV3000686.1 hypothetical protein [Chroococcopsis gigantea SAG 12.99]